NNGLVSNGGPPRRRVVVTGIGVISPNGIGREAYWKALRSGRSGVDLISQFPTEELSCRIAGEVKNFHAEDYLPPQDLRRVGRAVPLLLGATQEALIDAGVVWNQLSLDEKRSWGVIIGSGGGTPDFTEEQYRLFFSNQMRKVSAYNVSSSTPGNLPSEVSLYFDLRGPSHLISTGCTSSTDALGYAFNQIRFGLADHFVTGGADATITPAIMQGFCVMQAVSTSHNNEPARASRPFDRSRDGFVLGEGAWILVLEERELALIRGATIYAEVRGYASTCDAYHRVRLEPSGEEPARAMSLAIEDARLAKDEVGYIALHGTATVLNDKTETRATKLCFGKRARDLPMSSVKSMIGHPQGASGAAGVVAAICGMNGGFLPPTINLDESDPECDLNYIPNQSIAQDTDIALCNCIGFGSKNSALVIERGATV
ncbi:MAG TPA: beta-ketoacyl-[acyl-carrier-protein] synthase family protein, partial [Candidatus Limnocylindria bacterium]|nr:beta-ketoacyl-[acyl-carrier-protein] synthase family protein [Candidatus Limnocylindria bacterium]